MDLRDFFNEIEKIAKISIDEIAHKEGNDNTDTKVYLENFEHHLNSFLKTINDKGSELLKYLEKMGGSSGFLKKIWNMEEEKLDLLMFEDVVRWAKNNFQPTKHSAACLVKMKKGREYHLFFLNENQKPLLDGSEKHKIFYTNNLDEALKAQFQEKEMLILK